MKLLHNLTLVTLLFSSSVFAKEERKTASTSAKEFSATKSYWCFVGKPRNENAGEPLIIEFGIEATSATSAVEKVQDMIYDGTLAKMSKGVASNLASREAKLIRVACSTEDVNASDLL